MKASPVLLFVYKRPDLTRRTVESLFHNYLADATDLIIYSDGPRNPEDRARVEEVRKYIKGIKGFGSLKIIESDANKGLVGSIISGVTEQISRHGRVIVLEDDMVTSPWFLRYMNEGLTKYENEEKVVSIHGYIYPVKGKLPETFFLRGADCWGWATWKRGWDVFNPDSGVLLKELKKRKLEYEFDFGGTRNNIRMLKRQIRGSVDSWAIRWHASAFLESRLTLYPGRSLVRNIGLGADATHSRNAGKYETEVTGKRITHGNIPVEESGPARKIIMEYFEQIDPNALNRLIKRIRYKML